MGLPQANPRPLLQPNMPGSEPQDPSQPFIRLFQGSPTSGPQTSTSCQISSGIKWLKIKCAINVMCLNHPETTPTPPPSLGKNCLPWNLSLVPKRMGTADLFIQKTVPEHLLCPTPWTGFRWPVKWWGQTREPGIKWDSTYKGLPRWC